MIFWIIVSASIALIMLAILVGASPTVPDVWVGTLFLLLSIGATLLGSMVGLGGGLIITPVLILMGLPPPVAASSSLAATLSNAATSSVMYAKQGRIEYKQALRLGIISTPGSVLGAVVSTNADVTLFSILLGITLLLASIYVFIKPRLSSHPPRNTITVLILPATASFFAGVVSSFFGIGGGVVFVPVLIILAGMSIMRAASTSMFAILLASIVGMATHGTLGNSDAVLALILSAGGLIGGMVGAKLSLVVGEQYLRVLAVITLVGASLKLFWDGIM